MSIDKVQRGIHPNAGYHIQTDFTLDEQKIIKRWSDLWFITRAGKKSSGNSEYRYAYAKPTETMENGTGISKELVIIFSPYENFEARSLAVYDSIVKDDIEQRYEKLCYVLISKDKDIERKISEFISGQENQIIVPFSYDSFFKSQSDNYFIRNQLQKHFFSRDLFDYSEPLKREFFFFGRNDIVSQIVDKHKAGQNMGVFGLRKTGKTSIIYDVIRKSKSQDFIAVNIDCQNPSFNNRRWNEALFYIIDMIIKECGFNSINISENDFTEKAASDLFTYYIENIYDNSKKHILLMFDEVENISYEKSPSEHWCKGLDFVFFWQSIRSSYQKFRNLFTFCIFGTNPKCIEVATIEGKDNPIFNMIQPSYISGFSVPQTREMVRKLGRIMGVRFDETIYGKLVEDYGGHPFLIRRVCSKISQLYHDRPIDIDRNRYNSAKQKFNLENTYFDMILNVLTQFYPDEFEMLKLLAINDIDSFNYFVNEDPSMVGHLIGYGLIKNNYESYDFKIDAIKEYIVRLNNDHIKPVSAQDKWKLLCKERNDVETRLRKMVKNIIRTRYKKESDAKEYVIKKILKNKRALFSHSYNDLFDSRKTEIYLKGLFELILGDWDYFSDYFCKQDIFVNHKNVLITEGRFDAHATEPTDSEIAAVDNSIRFFIEALDKYEEAMS